MSKLPPNFEVHDFVLRGNVLPLLKAAAASASGHRPTRPMGGWLMTYGQIGPNGGIVPTLDRDNQIMDAARELGHIDWQPYLENGAWNDTHDEECIVGVPETLEFHDGSTQLSRSHGKVGFWTTGHLYDRKDEKSWTLYGRPKPSEQELERADHFWTLANLLKGLPRPLGFSAHGSMALSPCRSRIIWCQVRQAAVCELPKNPDATMEMLKGSPLEHLRKGMVGRKACGACNCPPWACKGLTMEKGNTARVSTNSGGGGMPSNPLYVPKDPASADGSDADLRNFKSTGNAKLDRLIDAIMQRYFVDAKTAMRWIQKHFIRKTKEARRG